MSLFTSGNTSYRYWPSEFFADVPVKDVQLANVWVNIPVAADPYRSPNIPSGILVMPVRYYDRCIFILYLLVRHICVIYNHIIHLNSFLYQVNKKHDFLSKLHLVWNF